MINTSRSERGWRGRRRIAVLVSIAGVLGLIAVGSATTASATTVANCKAKLAPKGSVSGNISFGKVSYGRLSFTCDSPIRTYSIAGNKKIKNYSAPNVGAASSFFSCEGSGVGFGCGVANRSEPGTQPPGTTGWTAPVPPYPAGGSSSTATPLTCNGYKRVQGGGTGVNGPSLNAIVTAPCTQVIAAGTRVTQAIKLGANPCKGKDRFQLNLLVGGEPAVTSFIAPVSTGTPAQIGPGGDSATVGEYLQAPTPVNLKAYKACQAPIAGAKKASKSSATKSVIPATKFPVSCTGGISPASTPGDSSVSFSCTQNIRAFAIYSNNPIDLPGDEPVVTGSAGGGLNESAIHQCEGSIPGPGYGCGTVDRQVQTAPPPAGTGLINGNGISAGNIATQKMGFEKPPCKGSGTKAWLVVMGEPVIDGVVGEFNSAPFPLRISGFGKCKGGKKK